MDAGAFVHALQYSSEVRIVIHGNPFPNFFATVAGSIGFGLNECAIISVDAEADVTRTSVAGAGAVHLVRRGKYQPGHKARIKPLHAATVEAVRETADLILGQACAAVCSQLM